MQDSSREENSLCCARESCTAAEDGGDVENAHTNLRLIEVNILGLELLVEGFDSSYVKTDWHDEIRARLTCLVDELRELSGQIADEDGKLLCTMETSPDKASCLLESNIEVYLAVSLFFHLRCTLKGISLFVSHLLCLVPLLPYFGEASGLLIW